MTKPTAILYRLLAVFLATNLALPLTAQSGSSLLPVAGAHQALKEAQAALSTCDFVRVRAQVGLLQTAIQRAQDGGESDIARSIADEAAAVQNEADQKEADTAERRRDIHKLIANKQWKEAQSKVQAAKAGSCGQLFNGLDTLITAYTPVKPARPLGPSAGQRIGSGIKWVLIFAAIAGTGYVAWDQYQKHQRQTAVPSRY